MPLIINLQKPNDLFGTLQLLRTKAAQHNLSFTGDEESGHGSGRGFVASYKIHGDKVVLTIHKKPFLVSNSRIIDEITKRARML